MRNRAGTTLLTALLLLGCHSSTPKEPTATTPATAQTRQSLTPARSSHPAEISAVLAIPIDPGQHIPKTSTIMCGWPKTGVTGDSEVMLNLTTPDYFEKEREPHPRITMTPAPGIGDDAYYITSEFGTSLLIKKGSTVISFTIRDKSIPSAQAHGKRKSPRPESRRPPLACLSPNKSAHKIRTSIQT